MPLGRRFGLPRIIGRPQHRRQPRPRPPQLHLSLARMLRWPPPPCTNRLTVPEPIAVSSAALRPLPRPEAPQPVAPDLVLATGLAAGPYLYQEPVPPLSSAENALPPRLNPFPFEWPDAGLAGNSILPVAWTVASRPDLSLWPTASARLRHRRCIS